MSLVRSSLSSHPQYRALSYCRGSLDELKPLTVVFEDGVAPISLGDIGELCDAGPHGVMFQITANMTFEELGWTGEGVQFYCFMLRKMEKAMSRP